MARVIVVTGTDTGVGKTFVTAAIADRLRRDGHAVRAVKLVESGCSGSVAGPDEDGAILAHATGQVAPRAAVQRLKAPLAPPVAAKLEGAIIRDELWADLVSELATDADFVFVEAAGGLLSPLSERFDALSLAQHLGADVLVVASDRLGCINHSRLATTVLEQAGFSRDLEVTPSILAVIFSEPAERDDSTGRNASTFAEITRFPRVATLARHEDGTSAGDATAGWLGWLTGRDQAGAGL